MQPTNEVIFVLEFLRIMSSISESFQCSPLNKNHIIPLNFDKVLNLPDSHTWTLSGNHSPPDPLTVESVPVIDLGDPNAITLIRHACEKWGVFQVTNHGIPLPLMKEVELEARRLFTLPMEQKLRAVRSPEGLTGYGLARISPFFPKLMWSEGFSIMGSPADDGHQLWPHDCTKFCNVMEEYQKQVQGLSYRMIGLMLGSLGLTHEDVQWLKPKTGSKNLQALLHLNSYPACPDPGRAMGLAPHTDSSLLTLLYQSSTSGLQVYKNDNIGWVMVQPLKGAIVVNVGDLMHILSNGKFKTTLHRAVVNKTEHRISIAYFCGPPRDVKVSPVIKLTDADHPPLYRQVSWKEYLEAKAMHFNKALEMIRNDVLDANG